LKRNIPQKISLSISEFLSNEWGPLLNVVFDQAENQLRNKKAILVKLLGKKISQG
jgi:hypothetical protein